MQVDVSQHQPQSDELVERHSPQESPRDAQWASHESASKLVHSSEALKGPDGPVPGTQPTSLHHPHMGSCVHWPHEEWVWQMGQVSDSGGTQPKEQDGGEVSPPRRHDCEYSHQPHSGRLEQVSHEV